MAGFEDDKTAVLGTQEVVLLRQETNRNAYLIVINGRSVGKMYRIEGERVYMGRSPECQVVITDDGVSRKHAFIDRRQEVFELVDNGSTNGIFVNGEKVRRHYLKDGDRLQFGSNTILKFSFQDEMEENFQKQLYDSATRDALTGAYNKKYFADQLKTEFAFCERHGQVLSLALFDIDHFKKLNDGWGHLAGDMVLKELAKIVAGALRTEDIFARYGGEEFGVILRDTDTEKAFLIAERVRRSIEGYNFVYDGERLPVTISIGVATLKNEKFESPRALVRAADNFLYRAKESGRNRTECELLG